MTRSLALCSGLSTAIIRAHLKRSTAKVLPILSSASQMRFWRQYQTWQNRLSGADVSHWFFLMLFGSTSAMRKRRSEQSRLRSPGSSFLRWEVRWGYGVAISKGKILVSWMNIYAQPGREEQS